MRPDKSTYLHLEQRVVHSVAGMVSGRKTVAAAGTAEALAASSTPCEKVDVQAELDNTGVVCVGGSNVVASASTRTGIALQAGDHYCFEIDNLADIYVDSEVNGEGVTFNYFT